MHVFVSLFHENLKTPLSIKRLYLFSIYGIIILWDTLLSISGISWPVLFQGGLSQYGKPSVSADYINKVTVRVLYVSL